MKTIKEIESELDITYEIVQIPKYIWYAYKNGEVHVFSSRAEAKKCSDNIEGSYDEKSLKETQDIVKRNIDKEAIVIKKWNELLREEYKDLNDNLYDVCYNYSYEKHHHAGNDSVADGMDSIVYFAREILEIFKKE